MAEVLLFNQYFTSKKESLEVILVTLPINLLCLASYLRENGIDCKIYELGICNPKEIISLNGKVRYGISDKEIINIIKNEKPKIIGLGCMYSIHYIDIISIARLIKSIDLFIKVVLGGNHATIFHESILKEEAFDFIVRGEGEITFYELCKTLLSDNTDFEKINGLSFRDKNRNIITNPNRELIKNLDDLPNIKYSLLDLKNYANVIERNPYVMRSPGIGIVTSRGCPGGCVFCTVKAVWGKTWRSKSVKKTVDEIELLNKEYNIREFAFLDDSASLDKKRWANISEEIINRKLNIRWTTPNGIAHWTLDKNILRKMKDAGCYRITFGIESGNKETRKFIGKPFSLAQAKELIRYANKIGMWTICTNIIGFPYETKESIDDTVRFAMKSGTDFATFYLLSPHLTSDVYSYFEKEGLLDFSFMFKDDKLDEAKYESMYEVLNEGGFPTKYFTKEKLRTIQAQAYRSFIVYRATTYLTLLPLLRKMHSIEDVCYTLRLLLNGLKIALKSLYMKSTKNLLYN